MCLLWMLVISSFQWNFEIIFFLACKDSFSWSLFRRDNAIKRTSQKVAQKEIFIFVNYVLLILFPMECDYIMSSVTKARLRWEQRDHKLIVCIQSHFIIPRFLTLIVLVKYVILEIANIIQLRSVMWRVSISGSKHSIRSQKQTINGVCIYE